MQFSKTTLVLMIVLSAIAFVGCTSTNYKVLTTSPSVNFEESNGDILISYNLWTDRGKLELTIENTGSEPVYIDWLQSTFNLNGASYVLYNPTTTTASTMIGLTSPSVASGVKQNKAVSRSVTTDLNRVEIIPPGMHVNRVIFPNDLVPNIEYCELNMNKGGERIMQFDEFTTPYDFGLSIAYCDKISCDVVAFSTKEFYVSSISLHTADQFKGELKSVKDCNGSSDSKYTYPLADSNSFYFSDSEQTKGGAVVLIVLACIGFVGLVAATAF